MINCDQEQRVKKKARFEELKKSRRLTSDFRKLSQQILHLVNQTGSRREFIHDVIRILLEYSASDSINFILHGGVVYGCRRSENNSLVCSVKHRADTELFETPAKLFSMQKSSPFITRKGSLWIGCGTDVLDEDQKNRLQTFLEGFSSAVAIPLHTHREKGEFLIMKSSKKFFFTSDEVELYEDLSRIFDIAYENQQSHWELRERVKELTCLYNIGKIVERPDSSFHEIISEISEMLPPSLQFPDIASCRIILDGREYKTAGFLEEKVKLASTIQARGKPRGEIMVSYSRKIAEIDDAPFLIEEQNLLHMVAEQISLIVEQKEGETMKQKLQEQLRHADRLATIGQLAAGVAHEINEPLNNILGFAQLMEKSDLAEQTKQDLQKIIQSSLHAREIVKKLVYFSRQMPPRKASVDLNKIVGEGMFFLESRCVRKGIRINRELSPTLPEINADPGQLHQVLVNLVVNAIQAMPEGGTLTIATTVSGKNIALAVRDTGIGMDDHVKSQLFIPFFTTKDVDQGTGLGLSVVHGIVSSHGGKIEVESSPGSGSCFTVFLPPAQISRTRKKHEHP
ncbi:MAG: ATP-binding protein [Candidatus Wallbacteria bacterium]|nr:ATP-binding protein [Candidatus Wallbacteria bacterium]